MGETAKHDVGKFLSLFTEGSEDTGMVVAMDRCPPGTHAVDEHATVLQVDVVFFGLAHHIEGIRILCLGVGMPDMGSVGGYK